jgi:2'-5' RNA ligase
MENGSVKINGTAFYEYLLVAHPDHDVAEKIMAEKQVFFQTYRQKIAIKTKPHITIANFLATEDMEETVIRWLMRIISNHSAFTVTLNNYSGFPPHTVYLRVQDHAPFNLLKKGLGPIKEYVESNIHLPVHVINKPHLSIARRLPEEVYEKAMIEYAGKTFTESFSLNHLVLLKRKDQFDACKQVSMFGMKPQQNNLFN